MAEHQLTCAGCGAQFTYHRRKKYCQPRCRPGWGYTGAGKGNYERTSAACRQEHECQMCGTTFRPKRAGRTTCCSRECGVLYQAWMRSIRANGGRVTHRVLRKRCLECGDRFTAANKHHTVCSDECRAAYNWRRAFEASAAKHDASPRDCKECGVSFVPEYGSKRRVYCSAPCARRHLGRIAGRAERARLRDAWVEAVNPFEVFRRDGWRCQRCKRKTPRRLRGTCDDRAPELDHIVPLADGGEHSYRNTQCLCRSCNAEKSDGPGGQLRLFG